MPRPEDATGAAEESQNSNIESLVIDQLFGDEVRAKYREEDSSVPAPASQGDDSEEETLDFGNLPNGEIRLKKAQAKAQRYESALSEAMQRIAKLEGATFAKPSVTEPESDPTEGMTVTERSLYQQNQELAKALNKVMEQVGSIDKDRVESKLKVEEEKFFSENPELQENRDEVAQDIVDYLRAKPALLQMVRNRSMSIKEAYAAMSATKQSQYAKPSKRVQSPDAVFTGERRGSGPAGSNRSSNTAATLERAHSILESKRGSEAEKFEAFRAVEDKVLGYVGGIVEKHKQMYS